MDSTDYDDILAKTFVKLLAIPNISKGNLIENDDMISVYSEWSMDDVPSKGKTSFVKVYSLLKSNLKSTEKSFMIHETAPIPFNSKLICSTKSGLTKAVVSRNELSNDNTTGEILQIFSKDKLEKTFDLKDLDIHKAIYSTPFWGCTMAWTPDESKLIYLAEKKIVKATPFFSTFGNCSDSNSNQSEKSKPNRKGDEFAFQQSWGEQLTDAIQSVIVVLDIETERFKILDLPDQIFPCDLQWVGSSSIVGTGYTDFSWRLGLIYCSNRESRIFQIDSDGKNFKYLSETGLAAFSPRIRPDGTFLVWEERKVGGPHDNSRAIIGLKLKEGEKKYTIYDSKPANKMPVYANLPQSCWTLDGTKLFTVTPNEIGSVLFAFNISDEQVLVEPEFTKNVNKILCIGKHYVLISKSSTLDSQSLELLNINDLSKSYNVCLGLRPISQQIKRLVLDEFSPPSFYYGTSDLTKNDKSVALIVIPHGGPHSVIIDEFSPEIACFLELGFGVLRINYTGSIGGSSDPEELCGKIGSADLKHCQNIVNKLIDMESSINPEKIVIFGGSHGGFLGAHLTSSFPDFYKAAALRNPVTDLTSIIVTSDITDWAYVEAGLPHELNKYLPFVRNVEDAKKLIEWSPIRHADKVKAGTLLLLGSEDIRVPMSQGLAYYRTLKHFNKDTEVRLYNDSHSLSKKVPCRFDFIIQSILWFNKYLKRY